MPSAYKWRPHPAGTLGHSVYPGAIRWNGHRVSLTPLETAFEYARATRGNRLNQGGDFARIYDEYQALDDETKSPSGSGDDRGGERGPGAGTCGNPGGLAAILSKLV